MDRKTERLETLKKKQEQIKAKIQALQASGKSYERKCETRRKILIGACYLEQARKTDTWDEIVKLMDGYLQRNTDRSLFGLAPKATEVEQTENHSLEMSHAECDE